MASRLYGDRGNVRLRVVVSGHGGRYDLSPILAHTHPWLASGRSAVSARLTSGMRFNACSWFEFLDEHPAYIRSAVVLENGRI